MMLFVGKNLLDNCRENKKNNCKLTLNSHNRNFCKQLITLEFSPIILKTILYSKSISIVRLVDDEPDIPAQINIVPAIDIIFSILAFFILASVFLDRTEGLPVNLPNATTAQTQERIPLTITLYPQGEIFLEGQPISIDGLEREIRGTLQSAYTLLIVLQADVEVRHGTVIEVMDRLRRIEGVSLAIATTPPSLNP